MQDFLTLQNQDILWEIIKDNETIQSKNPIQKEQIHLFFKNMIREFHQREKDHFSQLMNMNKAFITTFFTVLNTYYNAGQESKAGLITHEQIQEKRVQKFDKDLERRKNEFMDAMTIKAPVQPRFTDEKDTPLEELDYRMKQMEAAREMDLRSVDTTSIHQAEKWLQATETSVKSEKYMSPTIAKMPPIVQEKILPKQTNPQKVYIEITNEEMDNNEVIRREMVDLNPPKQLTWGSDQVKVFSLHDEKPKVVLEDEKNVSYEKLQKQIVQLQNTLEAHMEKCNNTLSIIYSLLAVKKSNDSNG